MSILSSAYRSAARTLQLPLTGPLYARSRLTSSKAGPSPDVAPASQSVKDLVPEEAKDILTAEVVSGAPGMLMFRRGYALYPLLDSSHPSQRILLRIRICSPVTTSRCTNLPAHTKHYAVWWS